MQPRSYAAVPASNLPGVLWPALPGVPGQRMLAMQFQFSQSERWPLLKLREAQFAQLAVLLRHARDTVPFYRERLSGLALDGPLNARTFASIPLLRRADIQSHFKSMVSSACPTEHGAVKEGQTSGSTGRPISFVGTELTEAFWHAFTLRDHLWHNRDFSAKLAAIRSRVAPGSGVGWGDSTDSAFHTGPAVMCNTERPIAEQAQWLMQENPHYLISVASNLQALAKHCRALGLRPSNLREVRTYGEALHPDARFEIRAAWDVPLSDMYSCREAGYLALQCPQHEHYHVQSESIYLELLNAVGKPCVAGEKGRVVITTLHNFAMPLIRYEIGDFAEAGELCDCGRGLPVIRRIFGRVRNMLRLPDGSQRHPRFGESQFGAIAPVLQFQVVQKSLSEIEVALVVARALTTDEENTLRTLILKNLGYPFNLTFSYRAEIPLLASGKYEDFRSEIVT
jgi:phenylacetate-CoA ligase